jgi:hypothetical protein
LKYENKKFPSHNKRSAFEHIITPEHKIPDQTPFVHLLFASCSRFTLYFLAAAALSGHFIFFPDHMPVCCHPAP